MLKRVHAGNILNGEVDPGVTLLRDGSAVGLANTLLTIVYIVAGLYAFINFLVAGFRFLAKSDKPETLTEVKDILLRSLMGLIVIVVSTLFAGLIGFLFFDDPTAILRPELVAPTPTP